MHPIRILLVDDHTLFRKGLASLLAKEKSFQVIGEAGDGNEGFKKATELKPDLVLMDFQMPGADGIETTRRIRAALPDTKVVILTVYQQDKLLFDAIKSGAHGYLTKNVQPKTLYKTLHGIFRGEAALSRPMATKNLR